MVSLPPSQSTDKESDSKLVCYTFSVYHFQYSNYLLNSRRYDAPPPSDMIWGGCILSTFNYTAWYKMGTFQDPTRYKYILTPNLHKSEFIYLRSCQYYFQILFPCTEPDALFQDSRSLESCRHHDWRLYLSPLTSVLLNRNLYTDADRTETLRPSSTTNVSQPARSIVSALH